MSRNWLPSSLTGAATALVVAATSLVGAQSALAVTVPNVTMSYTAANQGAANTDSGTYLWVGSPDTGLMVTPGTALSVTVGNITYPASQTPNRYLGIWYSCGSRGQNISQCAQVGDTGAAGSASGRTFTYTPSDEVIGRYLVFSLTQVVNDGNFTINSIKATDREKDLLVINRLGTTKRPEWGLNGVNAGSKANLLLFPWTMPSGVTFASRALATWVCPNASQGQEASLSWSTTGCTSIPAASVTGGNVNANSASIVQVQTSADMAGKTLVAQLSVIGRSANGTTVGYVVRSAGGTLPGSAAAATPSPSPSPTGTAAPEANAGAGGAQTVPNAVSAAGPVQPVMTIVAKRAVNRGKDLGVAVQLKGKGRGTTGNGSAIVEIVKSPDDVKPAAKLKKVKIKKNKGFKEQTIPMKLKKGVYYLRVVYTDAGSGIQSAALKRVRVR